MKKMKNTTGFLKRVTDSKLPGFILSFIDTGVWTQLGILNWEGGRELRILNIIILCLALYPFKRQLIMYFKYNFIAKVIDGLEFVCHKAISKRMYLTA